MASATPPPPGTSRSRDAGSSASQAVKRARRSGRLSTGCRRLSRWSMHHGHAHRGIPSRPALPRHTRMQLRKLPVPAGRLTTSSAASFAPTPTAPTLRRTPTRRAVRSALGLAIPARWRAQLPPVASGPPEWRGRVWSAENDSTSAQDIRQPGMGMLASPVDRRPYRGRRDPPATISGTDRHPASSRRTRPRRSFPARRRSARRIPV